MTLLAQPFPAGALCDESGLAITLRGVPVAEFNDPFYHDTLDRIQGDPSAVLKLGCRDLVGMARRLTDYGMGRGGDLTPL